MPFALVTIGLLMIVVGARGTHRAFGAQLATDFTGDRNFLYWIAAIGSVGALGYIETFRTFSHVFMSLIIVAMFLGNEGFFAKLKDAIDKGPIGSSGSVAPDKSFKSAAPDVVGNNLNKQGAPTIGGKTYGEMLGDFGQTLFGNRFGN